ncbi:MAG TPA: ester cyclase [Candidatus Dormibacteraeota bacterium]
MADFEQLTKREMDAWNARDESALAALMTDDITFSASGGVEAKGREAVHEFNRNWWTAFPDGRIATLEFVSSGTTTVLRGSFKGTQTGVFKTPMGDIQPTHKPVDGRYVQISHHRGEQVHQQFLFFDRMDVMEQLGLVPAAATA